MYNLEQYLHNRESGWRQNSRHNGYNNNVMRRIYSSTNMFNSYHSNCTPGIAGAATGAIFNLEFNAHGNTLVAATERRCVLVFDAVTQKEIHKISDAHTDCVNCIKFFDDRLFATGSDDYTVALWDLRNMKEKLRVLHGHSNWVKNIEYSSKNKLLVTSGFDGSIFTWDIKSQTEQGLISQRVFHASGLMRCRISPDGDKLIFCTSSGYIMIVHHLDLTTLHKDLSGFRPGIYRLMQLGDQYIPQAAKYDHIFSKRQRRNRVELVSDFPEQNDAEVIMALQIHPEGRCMLTRNVSCDEKSEWTCIHDINEVTGVEDNDVEEPACKKNRPAPETSNDNDTADSTSRQQTPRVPSSFSITRRRSATAPMIPPDTTIIPDIWAAEVTVRERALRQSRARTTAHHVSGYNFVYAISSGVLPVSSTNASRAVAAFNGSPVVEDLEDEVPNRPSPSPSTSSISSTGSSNLPATIRVDFGSRLRNRSVAGGSATIFKSPHTILVNAKKLMYYASETNNKPGVIKEPGFSADGRVICSPYGNGVRLLTYEEDCDVYPGQIKLEQIKDSPQQLVELSKITEHQDVVLCAKFSPKEPLLVTGCNSGEISWYRPRL